MAQQFIDLGSSPNDGTGDDLRTAGDKINDNFLELYALSGLRIANVTMSSAQILSAFTTPIELVPAPGAGLTILVLSVYAKMDYNSVAYATNTQYVIGYSSGGHSITGNLDGGFLSASGDRYLYTNCKEGIVSSNIVENRGVVFRVNTGNPTAGNSPVYISVVYVIVPNATPA